MTNEEARLQLALREMEFDRDNQRRRAEEAESRAREAVEREQVAVNEAVAHEKVIEVRDEWLAEIADMLPERANPEPREHREIVADVRAELDRLRAIEAIRVDAIEGILARFAAKVGVVGPMPKAEKVRDLLQRARIRLVDEPDSHALDAEIAAFLAGGETPQEDASQLGMSDADAYLAGIKAGREHERAKWERVIAEDAAADAEVIRALREYTREEGFRAGAASRPGLSEEEARRWAESTIRDWRINAGVLRDLLLRASRGDVPPEVRPRSTDAENVAAIVAAAEAPIGAPREEADLAAIRAAVDALDATIRHAEMPPTSREAIAGFVGALRRTVGDLPVMQSTATDAAIDEAVAQAKGAPVGALHVADPARVGDDPVYVCGRCSRVVVQRPDEDAPERCPACGAPPCESCVWCVPGTTCPRPLPLPRVADDALVIRAKIRMAWTFHGVDDGHGRNVITNRMHDAGMSRGAVTRVLADPVLSIAEVEVDATGTIRILSIRPIEQCPSTHDGVRCSLKEEHGPAHIATVPIQGGVEVHRWKA